MRHLLSIEDLDRADIERILDRASSFTEVSEREIKKVPALRGRRVAQPLLRGLDAHPLLVRARRQVAVAPTSSTSPPAARASRRASRSRTRSRRCRAYQPDLIVIRSPHVGAAAARRRLDDRRASSTPATASTSTRRRRCSTSTRCASGSARSTALSIWIVGDVLHSRVARSNILAFTKLGAKVTVCGPPTLIPRGMRGARLRRRATRSTASARPTSSTRCGCSTSA